MRTALLYYLDLWRGPLFSNKPTNDLMDYYLDTLFPGKDQILRVTAWYWRLVYAF